MIGNITTTICFTDLDTALGKHLGRRNDILQRHITISGKYRIMLKHDKGIGNFIPTACGNAFPLQFKGLFVSHALNIKHPGQFAFTHSIFLQIMIKNRPQYSTEARFCLNVKHTPAVLSKYQSTAYGFFRNSLARKEQGLQTPDRQPCLQQTGQKPDVPQDRTGAR